MSSILNDTKQVIGIAEEAKEFDIDLIMQINTAFFQLMQLGVGPPQGFTVEDDLEQWETFFQGRTDLDAAKSFVYVQVRLLFDRPETSYGIQALERMRDEFGWRLELQRREGMDV